MSICDAVQEVVSTHESQMIDKKIYQLYEEADKSFRELVDRGVAYKRGCQLLPMDKKNSSIINFNVQNI